MISIQHVSKTYDVPKKAVRRARGKSAGIDASYAASVSGSAVLAGAAMSQAAAEAADALRPAVRDGVVYALDDISIEIADGDIFGIIGMSGAGKSTLVRTINLLERPTSGRIVVDGQDVTDLAGSALRAYRRRVAMIFQNFGLLAQRLLIFLAFNETDF